LSKMRLWAGWAEVMGKLLRMRVLGLV